MSERPETLGENQKKTRDQIQSSDGLGPSPIFTDWIPASNGFPNHAEWVLIVVDNSERGLPHTVGMGWRKWQNDAGLVHETIITHWMPAPSLPNYQSQAAQAAPQDHGN